MAGQLAFQFVNTYENPIPTRVYVLFFTLRVDPLERGSAVLWRVLTQSVFTLTSHHALRWVGHLVESQGGLETKVGLKVDLVGSPGICSLVWPVIWIVRSLWNRALVRWFANIDYEMPEVVSDDLVKGSGHCP
ncbi:hypothetical protein M9H77_06384 [Catharanthus roseus]|uniref:Uncharacterized protein n=1 Tax=Catharanthus roseus TaxID=4058 RepID=A0ACC0BS34_CATRO|nr:hypothetical protein M9H77_06384 [Catharanthus roseus]